MRYVLLTLLTAGAFVAGVGAERHRSGDELKGLVYEVELLSAQVEILMLRSEALKRDAAEIRASAKAFNTEHL